MARAAKSPDDPRPWKFTSAAITLGIIFGIFAVKIAEARGMLNPFVALLLLACVVSICWGGAVNSNWKNRERERIDQMKRAGQSVTQK
jgi:hypothetical protein